MKKFSMIIPIIPKDYGRVKRNYHTFFEFLPIDRIVFIGPIELEEMVRTDAQAFELGDKLFYMDENSIVPFKRLKDAMTVRIRSAGYEIGSNSRPGWYYQQFLKMAYAYICVDDYYMSWDADTIPLRTIDMFDPAGKPYMDTKAEYNPGYFRTIKNLFGMEKSYDKSFISEHMLFDRKLMLEMIEEIEKLPCPGEKFYEKIFYSIDIDNMKLGFSEFETFGTWLMNRHPDAYTLREWHSMRRANLFTDSHDLTDEDIAWLAKDYDAASFESYHPLIPDLAAMFRNPEYRRLISARELYLEVCKSGLFGPFEDGMVREGNLLTPI